MSLLALHGFTGCGADFAPISALCDEAWSCPDLPGHGALPQLDCSPQATLATVDAHATNRTVLLGYSMGARAALLHATQHPQRWDALILISPNPGIEETNARDARRKLDAELADRIEGDGLVAFLNYWKETPLIQRQQQIRPEWLAAMQQNRLKHQPAGLANSLRQFGQGSVPNLWPELDRLRMPICIITGALDTKYTHIAQRLHRLKTLRTSHTVIDDASHMPHLENTEAAAAVILDFLAGL